MSYKMIINGEAVEGIGSFDVINPATEEQFAQAPIAGPEHLDQAVAAARAAFSGWSKTSDEVRKQACLKLADLLEANIDELAQIITQEQGRPLQAFGGQGAYFEVGGAAVWARSTAELELPVEVLQDDDDIRAEVHRKPLGVVGSITPWNWPLLIAIWHVIPALRSGNTVVIKPSSFTPLSTLKFVELAQQVLPPGVLNIICGEGGIGRAMTSHPDINKIVFTGSTPTGKNIMKNAATNLKRLTLELGGNDAGIILADVDIKTMAPRIFASAFTNSGQTCAALKRLYVHESIHDELVAELAAIARSAKVGNGLEEGMDYGPVNNQDQLNVVLELAADAKANGATFVTGGERPEGPGYFYPLTIVTDVTDGCRLVDEEPFGPILPVIKFSDIDEVIERANNNENGLGGSIWSSDLEKATALASRLESGTAWINNHAAIQPNVPFGGVKQSGFGVEFAKYGLEEYTSIQSVIINKH